MQLREMCCLAVLCSVFCTASTAYAGSFDELGRFTPEGDFAIGFGEETRDTLSVFTQRKTSSPDPVAALRETREDALEGGDVLVLGGSIRAVAFRSLESAADMFQGRRVRMTLWYKAAAAGLNASVVWVSGDPDGYMTPVVRTDRNLGELNMLPTGRVTSDGWIELSTGEVDFSLGSKIPASFLRLYNERVMHQLHNEGTYQDPEDRVYIDAFEIVDLGPAAVPDAYCAIPTEQEVCGEHGTCLFGKCVDAASIWGAPPEPSQRQGYSERLASTMLHHQGGRAFREPVKGMRDKLLAATSASARDYWYAYLDGLNQAGDGHVLPILQSLPWKAYGGGGACLGPGVADLLPDDTGEPGMIVFRLKNGVNNLVTQQLQPGDVLSEVDGLPWREWIDLVPYYVLQFSHNPDSDLHKASRLMTAAANTGATVTFKRCAHQDGVACSEQEIETITIDMAQLYGAQVWNGAPLQGHLLSHWCDWRFAPTLSYPDSESGEPNLFRWDTLDGVRHILFNGFTGWDPEWPGKVEDAFAQEPEDGFLLDMRWGTGGGIGVSPFFFSRFLGPANPATFNYYPWYSGFDEPSLIDVVDGCANDFWCVRTYAYPTSRYSFERYHTQPVAAVMGQDASGSEVAWLALLQREGPVRTFGYAASLGLFGFVCPQARMWGEYFAQFNHCSDMQIIDGQGQRSDFLAGTFLEPDERVYQRQSDAVNGVDTVIARAQEWLAEQKAMQGGQP